MLNIIKENKKWQNKCFWTKEPQFWAMEKMLKIFHDKICSPNINDLYFDVFSNVEILCLESILLETEPFENVKNQIGFCGIWCGSCLGGNGAIQRLAKKFEEIVKNRGLEEWVPKNFDFKEFVKGLGSMQAMSLCPGCRKGGGPSACKIRICALEKSVGDCSLCDQLVKCENFELLEKTHPKIKEDLMKIKNKNRTELIEKWMSELKGKWPHCILLCASTEK